jgi:hypothetical protein
VYNLHTLGACVAPRTVKCNNSNNFTSGMAGAGEAANARYAAAHRAAALHLWQGDVAAALAVVISADALTADFVSLAASGGRAAWLAATRAYAAKLELQGTPYVCYPFGVGEGQWGERERLRADSMSLAASGGRAAWLAATRPMLPSWS